MLFNKILTDYPRLNNETDDTPRIKRAIAESGEQTLFIPDGVYEIAAPITVDNKCSLLFQAKAVWKAVKEMDFVLTYKNCGMHTSLIGGVIDGNGLASCLCIGNYCHFTFRDFTLRNGKLYGIRVLRGCEMIVNNLYCNCTMSGMAGNIGVSSIGGDSHYTDVVIVDYTVGMEMVGDEIAGSNRLTRCHVWGGPVKNEAGESEMLKDSISFRISSPDTLLRDCYSDTACIGFQIYNNTRLIGCSYYNNPVFPLDDVIVIDHKGGWLLVADGYFTQHTDHAQLYRGDNKNVIWRDNYIEGTHLYLPQKYN